MDRGRLSTCPNQGLNHYCPVTKKARQSSNVRLDLYDSLVCPYDASTASVHVEPPPPHGATKPITRTPPSGPYGDLHANLEQGDSYLLYEQLPADGHVHPDGSVHPGVPPQPEQHH